MTTMAYWQERLNEKRAFWDWRALQVQFDYYPDPNGDNAYWPKSIARKTMYMDYTAWCTHRELVPDNDRVFFTTLAPYLYLGPKRETNHRVWEERATRAGYVKVRVSRYFAELSPVRKHMEVFTQRAGILIT